MNGQKTRLLIARVLSLMVFILMMVSVGNPHVVADIIGFVLIVIGGVGRIWSAAYISGFKSGKVVNIGPYSLVRNPLYFFSLLGFIGIGLVFGSILLTLALVFVFFASHWYTIKFEENKLRGLFGKEYDDYYNSTPRLFPKFSGFNNPETIEFYPVKFTNTLVEATYLIFTYGLVKLIVWLHEIEVLPNLIVLF